ncbi:response regulator transcription factor [Chitinophaga sp.]|uniref:response regulator transcription factor n=1 Tax=Chitinophaga sp. TaxID=1869181 RepID=UPI0031DAACE4
MSDQFIIIIDDHRLFAEGVGSLLEGNGFNNIKILSGENQLGFQLQAAEPPLILLDLVMENADGIELAANIKLNYPAVKILVVSMHARRIYLEKLLKIGVEGYILKNVSNQEMVTAIRRILQGERYFSPMLGEMMLRNMTEMEYTAAVLTPREKEILKLIAEGGSTKEIADQLSLSINTIETHRKNMLFKTGLRNVAQLIKWGYENGLL